MDDDLSYLGMRDAWDGEQPFGLHPADRIQHLYCIGKTGTGKSTLLRNLIVQDIHHGCGVGLIDPHGDLAHDILDCIPPSRSDHVVYFNPADYEHPIALNLLYKRLGPERHLVASGIVGSFKSIWRDSWGPRMEYVLYASIAALLECQNVSLLGVQRMLVDSRYRQWVVRQVKDPMVRAYWLHEFEGYDKRLMAEVISPVQNKVGQLLMAAPLRNILGQVRQKVDVRFMMDTGRIFIGNLAKGRLGEDKANLLGSLLVTQFQLAAMGRANVPPEKRRPFHLYIDEFQNFTTDAFASILSESRKYGLGLNLFHQYTAQLRPEVRDAVFGNVGMVIAFRVGETDGEVLEPEFAGDCTARQLASLSNYTAYVRPLVDGVPAMTFLLRSMPALPVSYRCRDKLIRLSRRKYTVSRPVVEGRIARWTAVRQIKSFRLKRRPGEANRA